MKGLSSVIFMAITTDVKFVISDDGLCIFLDNFLDNNFGILLLHKRDFSSAILLP